MPSPLRHRRTFALLAATAWLSGLFLCLPALAQETVVSHTVSFPERDNQYVQVSLELPVSGEAVEVVMPNWTPGSYVIRDYSAHLERFAAFSADGNPVSSEKVAKNRWRVATGGGESVRIEYSIWAGELHVSASWVESDFALINGAGVFLYSDESRRLPQHLNVELPAGWSRVHVALPSSGAPNRFLAADYDELVDSPAVAGNMQATRFEYQGQGYALINIGESAFWDNPKAIRDLTSLVRAHQEFWQINPFDREYLIFNFLLGFRGGLEHDHSTVLMSDSWAMRDRIGYIKWLALASHEVFHAWNVRRLRPLALAEYDYESEVYTRQLWLAEGLTSYYDNLLLFRAGLVNVNEYFDMLATEFRNYETMPGREIRSVEQASFDSWIKHYVPDANSVNSTASYYRRGGIIGFVTDAAIRRQTDDDVSLDDVMREMYRRYGPDSPGQGSFPPGAFEEIVGELGGAETRAMLERLLRTPEDPDVEAALDWFGLTLNRNPARAAAELSNLPAPAGLGLTWVSEGERVIVEHVLRGGAAAEAGVIPGDELIAINGRRVLAGTIVNQVSSLRVGDRVELTLSRHSGLLTLPVEAQHAIPEAYTIALKQDSSRRERARLENWLGIKLSFSP